MIEVVHRRKHDTSSPIGIVVISVFYEPTASDNPPARLGHDSE